MDPNLISPLILPLNEPFLKYCNPRSVGDFVTEIDEYNSSDGQDSQVMASALDTMFESRKWIDTVQVVSRVPSNRLDAIHLTNQLDLSLEKYQAKETGVCPIRRILFDKTMDEVIRQVTINCIDQGLLLYRIRNEFRMTLDAYKTLFESSIKFGLSYAVRSQKKSVDIEIEKKDLLGEKEDLKKRYFRLQKTYEATLVKHEEKVNRLTTSYQEEVTNLRMTIERQSRLIEVLNRKPIQL